jgi:hypothetical protein
MAGARSARKGPKLFYTDHARLRMNQRVITKGDVEIAVCDPDAVMPGGVPGTTRVHKDLGESRRLQVIYAPLNKPRKKGLAIITVCWLEDDS